MRFITKFNLQDANTTPPVVAYCDKPEVSDVTPHTGEGMATGQTPGVARPNAAPPGFGGQVEPGE